VYPYNHPTLLLSLFYAGKANLPIQQRNIFCQFSLSPVVAINRRTNGYDIIYNWFDHLKAEGHYIIL